MLMGIKTNVKDFISIFWKWFYLIVGNLIKVNKNMYQIENQSHLKKKKNKYEKLHSLKMFNFNSEWAHQPIEQQPQQKNKHKNHENNKIKALDLLSMKNQQILQNTSNQHPKQSIKQKATSSYAQNISSKKKAFSQLQSYKKLDLSNLKCRYSNPREQRVQQKHSFANQKSQLEQILTVNSRKLTGLKLPQIKTASRENKIMAKVKLENLKEINIHERIKTMKFTPQKQDCSSFCSEATTKMLKNKVQNISKMKKMFQEDQNTLEIEKTKRKLYKRQKTNEPNLVQMKQNGKKTKFFQNILERQNNKKAVKEPKLQPSQVISPSQNGSKINQKNEQNQASDSLLPIIQVYDKKMRIGRKKKSEEDKIRAMLLKTLEKTKGTDYIAQRGTSQKNNSPHNSTPKQKSVQRSPKQLNNQQGNLILVNQYLKQESASLKPHLKRKQLQKIHKSLKKNGKDSEPPQFMANIANKKYVKMVREVQSKKKKFQRTQLQEIKQQKTLSKQENDQKRTQTIQQQQKIQKSGLVSQETSQNQFLPNSARKNQKHF